MKLLTMCECVFPSCITARRAVVVVVVSRLFAYVRGDDSFILLGDMEVKLCPNDLFAFLCADDDDIVVAADAALLLLHGLYVSVCVCV